MTQNYSESAVHKVNIVEDLPKMDNETLLTHFGRSENNQKKTSDIGNVYDPPEQIQTNQTATLFGTTFHLIFLSAGCLAFFVPNKLASIGYVIGSAIMVLVFIFFSHNVRAILWSANEICKLKRIPSISYPEMVFEAFKNGPPILRRFANLARLLILLNFILIWFNACIFFYLLMAEYTFIIITNRTTINVSVEQIMIIFLIPTLTLCYIRSLKYLEPLSLIGFILSSTSLIPIIYYIINDSSPWLWPNSSSFTSMDNVPIFVGSILLNLNISGIVLALINEMKHPKKFTRTIGALNMAYMVILLIYLLSSFVFVVKYSDKVPENVANIIPNNQLSSSIALGLFSIALFLFYPLVMYVPFDVIWNDLLKEMNKNLPNKYLWECTLKTGLVLLCFMLAFTGPDLSLFFSISGSIGTSIDSLIFPAMVQVLVTWKIGTNRWNFIWIVIKNLIIIIIGIYLIIAGIKDCIKN